MIWATGSVANPWHDMDGYLNGQTGLVKFGQRFYDPTQGRWTQRDLVPNGNLYVYVGDNPINSGDPSGLLNLGLAIGGLVTEAGGVALVVTGVALTLSVAAGDPFAAVGPALIATGAGLTVTGAGIAVGGALSP